MLRLTSLGEIAPSQPAPRAFGRPSHAQRVSFGGVVFELLSAEPLPIDPEDTRFFCAGADPRTVADVSCAVRVDGGRNEQRPGALRFATEGATTRIESNALSVELTKLGPGKYAAAVDLGPGPEAVIALLRGVTAAIVHREGGVLLHAVGMELDGQGIVFIGPSGAGKSTAVRSTRRAQCFADDHVAIVPTASGWCVWGLPGGTPARVAFAPSPVFPLAAVLRVRQAAPDAEPEARRLDGVTALFALRESVEWADHSQGSEDVYLRTVMEIASQVAVGSIHTVRRRDHGDVVRAFCRAQKEPSQ